jgi:hypothetical protein
VQKLDSFYNAGMRILTSALGLLLALDAFAAGATSEPMYPREIASPQGRVVAHAPQIESWTGYEEINGVSAVEVAPAGADKPVLGAIYYTANTVTDLETHEVTFYNIRLNKLSFAGAPPEDAAQLEDFVRSALYRNQLTLPLSVMLQYLDEDIIPTGQAGLSMAPPRIFYATTDSRLLILDGPPMLQPIQKTDLKFALNTNWDLFYVESRATWYLLDGKRWYSLAGKELKGEWEAVSELPQAFGQLPSTSNWANVIEAVPAQADDAPLPQIFISEQPAELILVDGEPELEAIADTGISYVTNTESDLFEYDGTYFFLVSGRWFSTRELGTDWAAVSKLPDAFATIPPEHSHGGVLVSVPGTPEAKMAVLEAAIPRKAELSRDYAPPVNVVYTGGGPQFEKIESTRVLRAVNTQNTILQYESEFYLCYNAAWFISSNASGPWRVADDIPQEIYAIPMNSPAFNCTHVYVYDSDDEKVTTGYDSGYFNVYTSYTVMYGTGYYYYPYYYYPYYYYYPRSYGSAAWYNPNTGNFGASQSVYGPYGGASRAAVYNPETGTYARGRAVWDDDEIARQGLGYNPSTGTGAYTYRYANEDGAWGQSLVKRDDKWVATQTERSGNTATTDFKTSGGASGTITRENNNGTVTGSGEISRNGQTFDTQMKRTEDGVARTFTDEQGNTSGYARNSEGDLYASKDGEIYKREDGEWSKHDGEGWEPVERGSDGARERQGAPGSNLDLELTQADLDAMNRVDGGNRELSQYRDMGGGDRPIDRDYRRPADRDGMAARGRDLNDLSGGMPQPNMQRDFDRDFDRQANRQVDRSRVDQLEREHAARRDGFDRHASRMNRRGNVGGGRGGGLRRR